MYMLLRYVVGFAFAGLMLLDHWAASFVGALLFAGFLAGAWLYALVIHTVEYWHGTSPKWFVFLFGQQKNPKRVRFESILVKALSLLFVVFFTVIFSIAIAKDNIQVITVITLPMAWILGVVVSEIYVRRNYTFFHKWDDIISADKTTPVSNTKGAS